MDTRATKPMIKDEMTAIRSILVPHDFSPCAEGALNYALSLARSLGAAVHVLHVYQLPNYVLPDGTTLLASSKTLQRITTTVDDDLEAVRRRGADQGVTVTASSVTGAAADEIVRATTEGGCDLVVMGTHGRTGLKHFLLGSVADRVVHLSHCPVLTVRAPEPTEIHPSAS